MSHFPVINMRATGQNIMVLRKRNGLSVKALQKLMGFRDPQAIYKWQRGESLPAIDNLVVLSYIFKEPIENILVIECDEDVWHIRGYFLFGFTERTYDAYALTTCYKLVRIHLYIIAMTGRSCALVFRDMPVGARHGTDGSESPMSWQETRLARITPVTR